MVLSLFSLNASCPRTDPLASCKFFCGIFSSFADLKVVTKYWTKLSQGDLHRNDVDKSRVVRKLAFCICENKDADQLRGNHEADQRLFFTIWIVQSLYSLLLKFQSSSHLLWLYSPVCVGPGRKPRRPFFSQRGS